MKKLSPEFITIYYGSDVDEEQAGLLQKAVAAAFPEVEITLVDGGQPVYYYMIAVE